MTGRLDGFDAAALAARLDIPSVALFSAIHSTMDEAHRLAAEGAPAGTVVVADAQTAGRGRGGNVWASRAGHGLWMTLVERPDSAAGLDVLSLRLGLAAAMVLDRELDAAVQVKWPNDLYRQGDVPGIARQSPGGTTTGGKLGGILVEARWRSGQVDWVAIGLGINLVAPPDMPHAAGLGTDFLRSDLLMALVPALRAAAAARGPLTDRELADFAVRDYARGRRCTSPGEGTVAGIATDGALVVTGATGTVHYRTGSLIFADELLTMTGEQR